MQSHLLHYFSTSTYIQLKITRWPTKEKVSICLTWHTYTRTIISWIVKHGVVLWLKLLCNFTRCWAPSCQVAQQLTWFWVYLPVRAGLSEDTDNMSTCRHQTALRRFLCVPPAVPLHCPATYCTCNLYYQISDCWSLSGLTCHANYMNRETEQVRPLLMTYLQLCWVKLCFYASFKTCSVKFSSQYVHTQYFSVNFSCGSWSNESVECISFLIKRLQRWLFLKAWNLSCLHACYMHLAAFFFAAFAVTNTHKLSSVLFSEHRILNHKHYSTHLSSTLSDKLSSLKGKLQQIIFEGLLRDESFIRLVQIHWSWGHLETQDSLKILFDSTPRLMMCSKPWRDTSESSPIPELVISHFFFEETA